MDHTITKEFLLIINKYRKLAHHHRHNFRMNLGEFRMLSYINNCLEEKRDNHIEAPGIKVSELSKVMHATKPAASKMLNALEEKGYIERITDSKDRRVVYIKLSSSGEAILKAVQKKMYLFADHIIEKLGKEDAEKLVSLLQKLYQIMEDELGNRIIWHPDQSDGDIIHCNNIK
jgi:DNA-binding MarR family transcriptional regulator